MTARGLRIVPSWEDAPGVVTPELAATWSRLTIDVDGNYATWVEKDGTPPQRHLRQRLPTSRVDCLQLVVPHGRVPRVDASRPNLDLVSIVA